jgi:hypothetical protein
MSDNQDGNMGLAMIIIVVLAFFKLLFSPFAWVYNKIKSVGRS